MSKVSINPSEVLEKEGLSHLIGHVKFSMTDDGILIVRPETEYARENIGYGEVLEFKVSESVHVEAADGEFITEVLERNLPKLFDGEFSDYGYESFNMGLWQEDEYQAVLDAFAQTLLKLERAKEALREIKENVVAKVDIDGDSCDIEINQTRENLVEKYGFLATLPTLNEFIDFVLAYIEEGK